MAAAVALAGLGNMGLPIAERLLDAGFALSVWNRTPEKAEPLVERGAKQLTRPDEALREADVCMTVLADDAAFEDVVLGEHGVLAGARPGTVLIDMSTISVAASEHVAGRAAQAGVGYLRAPVSGSPVIVRGGTLTIMVSGPEDLVETHRPLLESIGPTLIYAGQDEAARVVKLVLQVLIGGTAELLAEALVLGETAGVDREKLLEAIGASVVGSRFVEYKTEPLLERGLLRHVHDEFDAQGRPARARPGLEARYRTPVRGPAERPSRRLRRTRARGRGLHRALPPAAGSALLGANSDKGQVSR